MTREKSTKILQGLRNLGITDTQILEHILYNSMSAAAAESALKGKLFASYFALEHAQLEFKPDTIDEDGYNISQMKN